jgi:hypothetical protein
MDSRLQGHQHAGRLHVVVHVEELRTLRMVQAGPVLPDDNHRHAGRQTGLMRDAKTPVGGHQAAHILHAESPVIGLMRGALCRPLSRQWMKFSVTISTAMRGSTTSVNPLIA